MYQLMNKLEMGEFVARLYRFLNETERVPLAYADEESLEFNNRREVKFPDELNGDSIIVQVDVDNSDVDDFER